MSGQSDRPNVIYICPLQGLAVKEANSGMENASVTFTSFFTPTVTLVTANPPTGSPALSVYVAADLNGTQPAALHDSPPSRNGAVISR
ncbi:MAG: hypothetical protein IJ355_04930 [Prevotella sp.]|nr:hypothetical protein [Prevotella sp.]